MITYILKELDDAGDEWISEPFEAREQHHIQQAVMAGFVRVPRWAETTAGAFVFGVAKGKLLACAPERGKR